MTGTQTETQDGSGVVLAAKGAGVGAAGGAFSSVIRLVTAVLLARWLGAEDYGLYILAITVGFAASSLASLGLDVAMERHIAIFSRRGDMEGTRGTLQVGIVGTVVPGAVVASLVLVLADTIARDVFDEPDLAPLLHLSAALTLLVGMSTLLIAVVVGFKRIDQATVANHLIQPVGRLVFLLPLALLGMSAFRAGIAITLSYVVSVGVLLGFINRRIPLAGGGPARRDVREMLFFGFPFWFAGFLRIIRTRIQPLLLGAAGSAVNVGVFSVVTSASMVGRLANTSLNTALRPMLAELHDAGDTKEVGRLYATTTRWTLSASLPVFVLMVLVPDSLLGLFGSSFETGVTALMIAASAEVVNAATGMCGPIIAMSGYNKLKVVNSSAWMGISVAANVVLIPLWGVVGAAIAILVSTTLINLIRVVELWVLMRVLPWDRHTWKPVAAAAGTAALGLLVAAGLPDRLDLPLLVVFALGIGIVFVGLVALLGLEPDDRLVLDRILRRGRRLAGRAGRGNGRAGDHEVGGPWS